MSTISPIFMQLKSTLINYFETIAKANKVCYYVYIKIKKEKIMFKGSLIKLILGAVILVFSYALPIFMIPVGSYSYSQDNITSSYSFQWNGKFKNKLELGDESTTLKAYYKIDDKAIYFSDDKDVKVSDLNKLAEIKNIYTLEIGGEEFKNYWALGFTIIGYVLTAWGLIGFFVPKKKK